MSFIPSGFYIPPPPPTSATGFSDLWGEGCDRDVLFRLTELRSLTLFILPSCGSLYLFLCTTEGSLSRWLGGALVCEYSHMLSGDSLLLCCLSSTVVEEHLLNCSAVPHQFPHACNLSGHTLPSCLISHPRLTCLFMFLSGKIHVCLCVCVCASARTCVCFLVC